MRFEFKPSFDRSVKSFHGREKEEIKQAAIQTIDIMLSVLLCEATNLIPYFIRIPSEFTSHNDNAGLN